MRRMAMTLAALAAALAEVPSVAADEGVLRVYNWSRYIGDGVIERFERETGLDVIYDTYSSGEPVEAMLLAGGSGYDVVVVSMEYLQRLIERDRLAPTGLDALEGREALDPVLLRELDATDPGNRFAVPYLWGTTGVAYDEAERRARAPESQPDSWSILFEPEQVSRFAECGVAMLDQPEEAVAAALVWLGHEPRSATMEQVEEALTAIARISPYVSTWDSSQIGALGRGEICLGLGWGTDVAQAREELAPGVALRYAAPRDGALMWIDAFVIPSDSEMADEARRFVEYMMRPEVMAANVEGARAAPASRAAEALIPPEILEDETVFPAASARERMTMLPSWDSETKRRLIRDWTRIKLGVYPTGG